jgi:3D (Asp-Asp-Asp) domain-containing protein/uncharacterized protein YabE (DUF348 family)
VDDSQGFKGKFKAVIAVFLAALLTTGAVGAMTITANTVFYTEDGVERSFNTNAVTVADFLSQNGVELCVYDTVEPPLDTVIENGMGITVLRGIEVVITVDGEDFKQRTIKTAQMMFGLFVAEYSVRTDCEYEYDLSQYGNMLYDGYQINLLSKKTAVFELNESIGYETEYVYADDLDIGTEWPLTRGVSGELVLEIKVDWLGGEEVNRKVLSETVTRGPINEVVMLGTRIPGKTIAELTAEARKDEEARIEAERLAEEKRLAEEAAEAKRIADEAEAKRIADAAAAKKKADADAAIKRQQDADRDLLSRAKAAEVADGNYKLEMVMEATAYCACFTCTKKTPSHPHYKITKSGTTVRVGTVAVDPKIIPLGTKLFVEGYGYAVAEDVGSAIKGNKIDLYMNTHAECLIFGRKRIRVYILHDD